MAQRLDTTGTDYTAAMLQGGMGGWTEQEVQQLKQRGFTMGDLMQLGLIGPPQPGQNQSNAVLVRQMLQQGATGSAAPTGMQRPFSFAGQPSYLGQAPMIQAGGPAPAAMAAQTGGGGSRMTWDTLARQYGFSARDVQQFQSSGFSPDQVSQSYATTGGPPRAAPAAQAQQPQVLSPTAGTQPETAALQQIAQIDPTSEALRTALGQSYLTQMQNVPQAPQFGGMPQFNLDLSRGAAAPSTADVQSYLNLYKQIDPTGYAQRAALAGQMGSYLTGAQQEAALGSTLDAATQREVEQATRAGQTARGNVYGTPQLVAEAMARGSAGEARRQQRQAALSQALGQQQGYLTSGAGMGDVANQLYGQGYQRYLQGYGAQSQAALQGYGAQLQGWQAQQAARQAAQNAALGYLGSGQTPYAMGSGYLNMAQQNAANAAQGGPQYNPQALGQQYAGAQFPQYGLDVSQLSGNWYNSLGAYGQTPTQPNRTGSALGGAAAGALSGATAGSALGPWGTLAGGVGGAIAGGVGGYYR